MPKRIISLWVILVLVLSTFSFTLKAQTETETPTPQFAPYIYPSFNLALLMRTIGVEYFTLAFVLSGGGACEGLWQGSAPIDQYFLVQDIGNLRALGGDVIISFGGAGGDELGLVCEDVESLTAAYQHVIDALDATHLDFDIEGDEARNSVSLTRRSQAIAALEAANPDVHVSYTIGVLPTGLTPEGVTILQNGIDNGVRIDLVNLMTMDYGSDFAPDQMGAHAISAAEATFDQLAELYSDKTESELWAMIGITPMIGINDVQAEVFTLEDAQAVTDFAIERGLGRLAMWSMERDTSCIGGQALLMWNCSGIEQEDYAFAQIFNAVTPQ